MLGLRAFLGCVATEGFRTFQLGEVERDPKVIVRSGQCRLLPVTLVRDELEHYVFAVTFIELNDFPMSSIGL